MLLFSLYKRVKNIVKILNVISQYPGKTGSGTYLQSLIREGKNKGYSQALIAALSQGDDYRNIYVDEFYPVYFESKSLPFPIVGMSDVMPYRSTKYANLEGESLKLYIEAFRRVVGKAIEDCKPDLIISHHLWLLTSIVIEEAKDIKVIGVCHGTDIRQLFNNPQFKSLVTSNMNELHHVISLSASQRDEIEKHYKIPVEKIKVVGGGFNQEIFYSSTSTPYNKDESIKLIYVGKLSYQKGLLSLIKVVKKLKKRYPLKLTIVGLGFGPEEAHIKKLGEDNKDIIFMGEVGQHILGDLYRESDIFVLPSFYEGLSLVSVEALASGLLAVVSEIPSLKEFLGQAINSSGVIEYINLPEMKYESLPEGPSLKAFERDLEYKLEKQINRLLGGYTQSEQVKDEIQKKSWSHIYKEIEVVF